VFHYAWLLILIGLEVWRPPARAVFQIVGASDYRAVWYTNLAWSKHKPRQQVTDFIFYGYFVQIAMAISVVPRVPKAVIDQYFLQAWLRVDMHYIYVRA